MTPADRQLDDCLSVRAGRLRVEGCDAEELARRFGTPIHVVSEDQLRRNVERFRGAFAQRWSGGFMLLPSIKANSSLALRRILSAEGVGCDVFGAGELDAALRTGTAPEAISLNGPMKSSELLERAIGRGVRITLDSAGELERAAEAARSTGRRAHVRLRCRPDLIGMDGPSEMSPQGLSVRDAVQRYKAGIPTEDLLSIPPEDVLENPDVHLAGLMVHVGRHVADPGLWGGATSAIGDLLELLRDAWPGWEPGEIDVGGGFPVPRDPFGRGSAARSEAPGASPPVDAYAEAICGGLAGALERVGVAPASVELHIEPGRALYADAGIHLATVGNVKRQTAPQPLCWVETDSSDSYLPDVNLEANRWTCLAVADVNAPPSIVADVTGRTCALDVIVPDADLPEVEPGDVLAFLDTGAYQDAAASNFNALPRPGTVLVHGQEAEMIRRHETIEDVFARDLIPARLGAADGGSAAGFRVSGIDHFSVTCGDLDRSLSFYGDLLGARLRARGQAEDSAEFEVTGIDDAHVRWADLELPDGRVLELLEFVRPRGTARRAAVNDPGATHISLRVDDIEAAHGRLAAAGVSLTGPPVLIEAEGPWQGVRCLYATDPDGVNVELLQLPNGRNGAGA